MGEFAFMEDWDLQAVVRGCTTTEGFSNIMNNSPPSDLFSPLGFDQDEILSNFPDIFQSDGQQKEICKPDFYPQSILNATSSMSIPSCEVKEPEKKQSLSKSSTPASAMAPKLKKSRKNLQKRVVKHVAADDLSSDKWAWRKYGQKPIKGSPYPRSYYRCSSLKGCLARKQVERSSADPSIFIITYSAEHSHAYPTRRNSLAGCTRIKPTIPNTESNPKIKDENLDLLPNSATTPSMASSSHGDDFVQRVSVKDEEREEHAFEYNIGSNEFIAMPDIIFSEDLFPSLEDFDGLFLDHFSTVP